MSPSQTVVHINFLKNVCKFLENRGNISENANKVVFWKLWYFLENFRKSSETVWKMSETRFQNIFENLWKSLEIDGYGKISVPIDSLVGMQFQMHSVSGVISSKTLVTPSCVCRTICHAYSNYTLGFQPNFNLNRFQYVNSPYLIHTKHIVWQWELKKWSYTPIYLRWKTILSQPVCKENTVQKKISREFILAVFVDFWPNSKNKSGEKYFRKSLNSINTKTIFQSYKIHLHPYFFYAT